jgi:hypothetical protein
MGTKIHGEHRMNRRSIIFLPPVLTTSKTCDVPRRQKTEKESDMAVILTDKDEFTIETIAGLFASPADAEMVTGWILKPEGMCRDELCVPLTGDARRDGNVDIAAFWRTLGNPVLSDQRGDVWVLGTAAEHRASALSGLEAPDFTLPDLAGVPHTLSALTGKKVFLTTWASW